MVRAESRSQSKKDLRSSSNKNKKKLPYNKPKHKTYGKLLDKSLSIQNNSKESTLENNRWKDSFDRLFDSGSSFGGINKINKIVRHSHNKNCSINLTTPTDNITSHKSKKIKNIKSKNDERSPFNLDKSIAAINKKIRKKLLKNPTAKRKIQKNQNNKKQIDIIKNDANASTSTPLGEKKLKNYLQTCEISPIKPQIRKLFTSNAENHQKFILNYTDSIEEARNLSLVKLNNDSNNYGKSKNHCMITRKNVQEQEVEKIEELKQNEHNNIIENNQAGLELNDTKMKYVLSYIKKLPSDYEKYCFSDVSNISRISDNIDENNQISQFDNYNCIISLNSTHSKHESLNNLKEGEMLKTNHKIITDNELGICSKMVAQECIIDENKKILPKSKISVHNNNSIQLIEDSNSVNTIYKHKQNQFSNNTNTNSCGNSIQIIENNTDNISPERNCRINSMDNNEDYLIASQFSNNFEDSQQLLKMFDETNSAFVNKLKFLQNLQVLNDNAKYSKSINDLDHNENENLFRRHTIGTSKDNREQNVNKLNMNLGIISPETSKQFANLPIDNNLTNLASLKKNQEIQEELPEIIKEYSCRNDNEKNITNSANNSSDQNSSNNTSSSEHHNNINLTSLINNDEKSITNDKNKADNLQKITLRTKNRILKQHNKYSTYKETLEKCYNIDGISEKHVTQRRQQNSNNNENTNIFLRNSMNSIEENNENMKSSENINKPLMHEVNLKGFDPECKIIRARPSVSLEKHLRKNRKLTTTSTEIVGNCIDNKNVMNSNLENSAMSLIIDDIKYKKDTIKRKQSEVNEKTAKNVINNNDRTSPKIRCLDRSSEIISGTPMITTKRITRTHKLPPKSRIDKNPITEKNLLNLSVNLTVQELKNHSKELALVLDDTENQNKHNREINLISSNDRSSSQTQIIDSDCEIIPGTPLQKLERITRTRKLRNISKIADENIIKLSEQTNDISVTGQLNDDKMLTNHENVDLYEENENTDKRLCDSIPRTPLVDFKFLRSKRNLYSKSLEEKELDQCKINLKRKPFSEMTYSYEIDKNFKLKKCKIVLNTKVVLNHVKMLAQSKKNSLIEYFSNNNTEISQDVNAMDLMDDRKVNNLIDCNKSNTPNTSLLDRTHIPTSEETISGVNTCCVNNTVTNSVENNCSIIEISFDEDKLVKKCMQKDSNIIKTPTNITTRNSKKMLYEKPLHENEKNSDFPRNLRKTIINADEKPIFPAGKWRRTLNNWKKNQIIFELDESQIPVVLGNNTIINLGKSITDNKYKLMPKQSSSFKQNKLISDQLVDKELKTQILPVQKIIRNNDRKTCLDSSLVIISEKSEAECKIIEKRQTGVRKTLLLEPTDDGTPNYTTCSLFNTFAKPKVAETLFVSNRQQSKNSKRFIEIEEEDFNDLQQKDDQQQQQQIQYHHREEYSDESRCTSTITHKNNKQKYHHQLSVPICGTKNSSIVSTIQRSTRRGRTSIIETTNNSGFEQLSSSSSSAFTGSGDYHHHNNNREFIHSLLLNEDEQNILLCPSLNVSIRALLSPRDIVLRRCGQTDPYDFSIIYSEIELRQCRKIGEGVYGEVYMNKNRNGDAIVLKIIPIDGQIEINGEQQKNFEQILPEIIIAAELSRLRNDTNFMTSGFVEVKNVHCVQGRYPQHLIDLWELYRDNCGTENDHPEIFQDDQLYIVLELANGGQDLEAYQFQNALQSYSAFLQTALSLAVAERKFKFEHRDLHWGNILLAPTDEKEINFKFNEKIISIPTHGVKATIIDYTLSRMNFEGCCLYNDLSNDNELFTASGDYQFDIYRVMQKNLGNQWERYDPYTNILWLHYIIDKMISGVRYRSSKTRKHRSAIHDMMELRDELLDYKSASDYVECLD